MSSSGTGLSVFGASPGLRRQSGDRQSGGLPQVRDAGGRQDQVAGSRTAQGTGLINPFGLLKSRDGGRTWDKLGLEGEPGNRSDPRGLYG